MLCRYFKEKMVIGRDQCYEIFRSNGLVQRKKRVRPKTTNSNHNYYIYPDLLNTTPKFVAQAEVWLCRYYYVSTRDGWAFSRLTDSHSRAIVGYSVLSFIGNGRPDESLSQLSCFTKRTDRHQRVDTSFRPWGFNTAQTNTLTR